MACSLIIVFQRTKNKKTEEPTGWKRHHCPHLQWEGWWNHSQTHTALGSSHHHCWGFSHLNRKILPRLKWIGLIHPGISLDQLRCYCADLIHSCLKNHRMACMFDKQCKSLLAYTVVCLFETDKWQFLCKQKGLPNGSRKVPNHDGLFSKMKKVRNVLCKTEQSERCEKLHTHELASGLSGRLSHLHTKANTHTRMLTK